MAKDAGPGQKRRETQLFLFITIILFPLIAVGLVAAYGFMVWMWQLVSGPPGI